MTTLPPSVGGGGAMLLFRAPGAEPTVEADVDLTRVNLGDAAANIGGGARVPTMDVVAVSGAAYTAFAAVTGTPDVALTVVVGSTSVSEGTAGFFDASIVEGKSATEENFEIQNRVSIKMHIL